MVRGSFDSASEWFLTSFRGILLQLRAKAHARIRMTEQGKSSKPFQKLINTCNRLAAYSLKPVA